MDDPFDLSMSDWVLSDGKHQDASRGMQLEVTNECLRFTAGAPNTITNTKTSHMVPVCSWCPNYYRITTAGACAARERLVLRLLYVFRVCLFVCLFVHPHLSRAQYITSYITMQLQCIAAFGGLQAKL